MVVSLAEMDRPRTLSSDMPQVQFERKGGVEPTCLVGSMQPMQHVQQHPGHLPTAIRSAWEGLIGSCNPDDVGEVAKFFEKHGDGKCSYGATEDVRLECTCSHCGRYEHSG